MRKTLLASALAATAMTANAATIVSNESSDFQVAVGGYAKLDIIADLDGSRDKDQFLVSGIPVKGDADYNRSGYYHMHVRESRVNLDISKKNSDEVIRFHTELDTFGGSNSTNPRIRLLYVQMGKFIVGQYWTAVTDLRAIPYYIDFAFGEALYGGRTVQARYQTELSEGLQFIAAIEEPSGSKIDNPFNIAGEETNKLPLLGFRLTKELENGHLNFGSELVQLHWDGIQEVSNDDVLGWSVLFSGSYNILPGNPIKLAISHGDGSAKGVLALAGGGTSATLDENGKLHTDEHTTIAGSYTHHLTEKLNVTLGYAWLDVTPSKDREVSDVETAGIGHLSMLYQYSKAVDMGVEYMWGDRENIDGREGDASRLQAMVRYTF
ncbi:DcaP family trimeric outer membrane transporter [Colwellia sp. MEBiC06753]